jgi:hypothetical protein
MRGKIFRGERGPNHVVAKSPFIKKFLMDEYSGSDTIPV